MSCFRLCIFLISLLWSNKLVNCKLQSLWIGSGYINLCTFRHTIKVTDHHGDGAKVVPCELITFDYVLRTHQSLEMSTCLASFDHSTMAALWLECGRRYKHEIDTLSACDPEHRRLHKISCQLLSGNWAENNEIYCDTHKLRKLANFIYSVFLKITFKTSNRDGNFKLVFSYFGTPGFHYDIRTRDVLQHF